MIVAEIVSPEATIYEAIVIFAIIGFVLWILYRHELGE